MLGFTTSWFGKKSRGKGWMNVVQTGKQLLDDDAMERSERPHSTRTFAALFDNDLGPISLNEAIIEQSQSGAKEKSCQMVTSGLAALHNLFYLLDSLRCKNLWCDKYWLKMQVQVLHSPCCFSFSRFFFLLNYLESASEERWCF